MELLEPCGKSQLEFMRELVRAGALAALFLFGST